MLRKYWKQLCSEDKLMWFALYLGTVAYIVGAANRHRFGQLSCAVVVLLFLSTGFFLLAAFHSRRKDAVVRPVVYLCETPGMRTLCPAEYFDLALERKRIIDYVDVLSGRQSLRPLVAPDALLFFPMTVPKERDMGPCKAGGEKEFQAITAGCKVVNCRMYVPQTEHSVQSHGVHPISLDAGWQIIHSHPLAPCEESK